MQIRICLVSVQSTSLLVLRESPLSGIEIGLGPYYLFFETHFEVNGCLNLSNNEIEYNFVVHTFGC